MVVECWEEEKKTLCLMTGLQDTQGARNFLKGFLKFLEEIKSLLSSLIIEQK